MRMFVSILTAGMLLVHALVGCCWHQVHCSACCKSVECAEPLVADCCHHGAADGCDSDERPVAPCECKLQCKAHCVSLPPEKTHFDTGRAMGCFDFVAVAGCAPARETSNARAHCAAREVCRAPLPPLRLHLLHQIILV